jgi:PTS system mannose-specific IIB component/fructoselysine and glucoselysine-specific PTS system IIB component
MVLTADVGTMAALRQTAPPIPAVNIGGIHHRPGRSPRLPYVYLTDDEFRMLQAVEAAGTEISAQDLPNTPPVPLSELA